MWNRASGLPKCSSNAFDSRKIELQLDWLLTRPNSPFSEVSEITILYLDINKITLTRNAPRLDRPPPYTYDNTIFLMLTFEKNRLQLTLTIISARPDLYSCSINESILPAWPLSFL